MKRLLDEFRKEGVDIVLLDRPAEVVEARELYEKSF